MLARVVIVTFLLLLSQLPSAQVFEEEGESTSGASASGEEVQEQTGETVQPPPPPSSTARTRSGSFETFTPSEDISEDLSVPFPVDI